MRASTFNQNERTTIIINLKSEQTVEGLKQAIKNEIGIPPEQQQLIIIKHNSSAAGALLKDRDTLKHSDLEKAEVFLSFGELEIRVHNGTEMFVSRVHKSDTVETLKEVIEERFGIPIVRQTLRLNNTFGLALEDTKTMDEYGIEDGQTILLSLDEFQIKVKYGWKSNLVQVKATDTVETLKKGIENIAKFGNIPHQHQVLIIWDGDIVLEKDNETMDECRIRKGETVVVPWKKFEILVQFKEKQETIEKQQRIDNFVVPKKNELEEAEETIEFGGREHFRRKVIPRMADQIRRAIQTGVSDGHFAITSDGWSKPTHSPQLQSLTIHWIDDNFCRNDAVLGAFPMDEFFHSGEVIAKESQIV
ncbi:hypothetical protein niasHT_025187 [Heterodera trifolii]|uniref:Ubiquitin-like domain-containing protein n=1 Tax=Heterodera trifolii TaxID=157864 RepID=A0ABD2JLC1_9BILA